MDKISDESLVEQSLKGDGRSFETLVQRYQTLVCSIAYSITGNLALSEEVGQDSLLEAWKQLHRLNDKSKFKSWLCSIARHAAHNTNRRVARIPSSSLPACVQDTSLPVEERAMLREQADLVWHALEGLPETYREPLVLYYRQGQSISQVAQLLDLSDDTIRQRLSRGRAMLRDEVAGQVQRTLFRTAPSSAFTAAVLAAIPALSSQTAMAATSATAVVGASAAKPAIGTGTLKSVGFLGSVVGPLVGLLGAALGVWCGWVSSRYQSERRLIVRSSLVYLVGLAVFSLPYIAMRYGWQPWNDYGHRAYAIMNLSWMGLFFCANLLWIFTGLYAHAQIVKREVASKREPLPETSMHRWLDRYEGRRWTSRGLLLGIPLIDVQFSSPGEPPSDNPPRAVARGWIAIGDFAVGRLIGLGNVVAAPIALGTLSIGVISAGVCSAGVISISVISAAILSAGIVAAGLFSVGILSIGYLASGIVAIAWKGAKGVVAIAYHYAVGEQAITLVGSEESSQQFVANSSFLESSYDMLVSSAQLPRFPMLILAAAFTTAVIGLARLAYRRKVDPKPTHSAAG